MNPPERQAPSVRGQSSVAALPETPPPVGLVDEGSAPADVAQSAIAFRLGSMSHHWAQYVYSPPRISGMFIPFIVDCFPRSLCEASSFLFTMIWCSASQVFFTTASLSLSRPSNTYVIHL